MATTGSSCYFTEDIIFEILSWLPIISLLRSRAVCKLWRSIISNPRFVETHLANSQKKQASVLRAGVLRVYKIVRNEEDFIDIAFMDTRNDSVRLDLPPLFVGMKNYIRTCNGIICHSNRQGDIIHLWNPSTKQFKILPTPKIQAHCFNLDLGFCFDSVSKDYKLLRVVSNNFSSDGIVTSVLEAELYSANADSWKKIQVPKTVKSFWPLLNSKCVHAKNGVLYMDGAYELLSFDLRSEVIRVYPLHTFIPKRMSNILNLDGYVAMISESDSDPSVLSIWMMDDASGKMSWTKRFNLESDLKLEWTDLYLGGGEFVAKNDDVGHIFYDYRKKVSKRFPGPSDFFDVISVVGYTESLVSLEGFEQLE
ncbi:hypothetical protein POM88_012248 [Heracleum sosnowskyi]|uniref:F-box domain-containing protein n=1 Tax=Heracleum sosnowskyi TaxID=360622 RepID=A0AAD8IZI6_9APIA|nr:hypothetical protein POM88_012248 [Heracleum sosnowskyi]